MEQRDEGMLLVRAVAQDAVHVADRSLTASFLLAPDRCIEHFPARTLSDFDATIIDSVLALNPAVVLVGTGVRQVLAPAAVMARFLARGVGLETMDSRAAARTYNLLASEGRRVVAVFLL
ncbi:MAG TPA: MTH938/NDUFAF3 family protein [Chiayiivirga sp.]|nr:MTH938/NDUFAF3 family protein [Chiayiivirga sp.]